MNILVSACLLGCKTRYGGDGKLCEEILELERKHHLIPVCPEQLGGLATPREPAERRGERVLTRGGSDVTDEFERGAQETLRLAKLLGCGAAVLKERSPSCGSSEIYDGTFSGTLTPGEGITAKLLRENGIRVISDEEVSAIN